MTLEEALPQLAQLTGLSPGEWSDFISCTPDQQKMIVGVYSDAQWVQNKSTFQQVLAILGLIGTVAGVVSGVAGAASAVAALRTL